MPCSGSCCHCPVLHPSSLIDLEQQASWRWGWERNESEEAVVKDLSGAQPHRWSSRDLSEQRSLFQDGSGRVAQTPWSLILCYKGIFSSKPRASKQSFLGIWKAVNLHYFCHYQMLNWQPATPMVLLLSLHPPGHVRCPCVFRLCAFLKSGHIPLRPSDSYSEKLN